MSSEDNSKKLPPDATRAELIERVNQIHVDIKELLEIFHTIKGGVKLFVLTSKVLQWVVTTGAAIVAVAGAVFAAITFAKTGKLPYDH